jgi:hypothetical protein
MVVACAADDPETTLRWPGVAAGGASAPSTSPSTPEGDRLRAHPPPPRAAPVFHDGDPLEELLDALAAADRTVAMPPLADRDGDEAWDETACLVEVLAIAGVDAPPDDDLARRPRDPAGVQLVAALALLGSQDQARTALSADPDAASWSDAYPEVASWFDTYPEVAGWYAGWLEELRAAPSVAHACAPMPEVAPPDPAPAPAPREERPTRPRRPAPKRCLGVAEVEGDHGMAASEGLSAEEVSASMGSVFPRIARCVAAGSASPSGALLVRVHVSCRGTVDRVQVLDPADWPAEVVKCATERVRWAEFPAHGLPDGDIFEFPLSWSAGG